jgi:hypothetical protein
MENIQLKIKDRTSDKTPKFFCFDQNNSGGSFVVDEKLTHRVIVEADDEDEASDIGERLGVYFNGCEDGYDCDCCGDRWYTPSEVELQYGTFNQAGAEKVAAKYKGKIVDTRFRLYQDKNKDFLFENIEEYAQYMANEYGWCKPDVRIFYKNGEVKEFYTQEGQRTGY